MDFSSFPARSSIGSTMRFIANRMVPKGARIPILQGPAKGKLWLAGSHCPACWLGSYEHDKQGQFSDHIRKGDTVFDIGAHRGFLTLVLSSLVGQDGRVVAFEPVPANVAYLQEHLRLNRIQNVTLHEVAVSDQAGTAHFDEVASNESGVSGHFAQAGGLTVTTVGLDEAIAKGELPVPDHVKLDVEGAELTVLMGAQQLLKDKRPTLFLDAHGREMHRECSAFLQTMGYELQTTVEEIFVLDDGTERYFGELLCLPDK